MKQRQNANTPASPGHFGVYGQGGILFKEVLAGTLEAARGERSDWMVRRVSNERALGDLSMRGLVCASWPFGASPAPNELPYPIVNASNSHGVLEGVGNLLSDDLAVGRMAADFFRKQGVNHLLVLAISGKVVHEERSGGAVDHARHLGLTVQSFKNDFLGPGPEIQSFTEYTDWIRELLFPVLESLPLGAGIFCTNDWLGQQMLLLLQRHFPEHLDSSSILGVDNDADHETYFGTQLPALSSIQPAFLEIGREAFHWLAAHPGAAGVEQMTGLNRRFPPLRVVERASTAAGSCADPLTARMIRWVWERLRREEAVSVAEMARVHRLHVKTLERRFQEHTGGNAVDLITRMKLDLAKSLLRETTLPIAEISARCGYSKQDVLSRALRAAEGCTPREYRGRK
jgi:AraC-like DNA-binding protein